MLPNWLYGKSKSKLADILGGGGTTYTAGPGISISSDNRISFRGDTAPYDNSASGLEADTVKGAIDELTDDLTTVYSGILTVDSENADLKWNYGGASANNIAVSFTGFITTKRDATSGENSWINIGTLSKKPKAGQQMACPRINNSEGTIVCTNISIDLSGNVLFNMRSGMKSGDQFSTTGLILL
jgi:hypothetical protein